MRFHKKILNVLALASSMLLATDGVRAQCVEGLFQLSSGGKGFMLSCSSWLANALVRLQRTPSGMRQAYPHALGKGLLIGALVMLLFLPARGVALATNSVELTAAGPVGVVQGQLPCIVLPNSGRQGQTLPVVITVGPHPIFLLVPPPQVLASTTISFVPGGIQAVLLQLSVTEQGQGRYTGLFNIAANAAPGPRDMTVRIQLPTGGPPVELNCPRAFTVTGGPTTTISKTVDQTEVCPGDFLTYTITVGNSSSTAVGPLQVVDGVPAGTTFVSANLGGVFTPAPAPGQVTWSISSIPSNSTVMLTMTVQVNCDMRPGTRIINQATLQVPGAAATTSNQVVSVVTNNCPPVSHPCDGPPWAETTITVDQDPPIVGRPNRICAVVMNNTNSPVTACTLVFGVFPFGFGAPFTPVATLTNVMLQPGANTICVPYVPTFSGHTCVRVIIRCPGFPDQISQRNLDNNEIIPPGGSDSLPFTVCNPDANNPAVIQLSVLANCPGVTITLSETQLTLGPGECKTVTVTVNVGPNVPVGTMCTFDVVGYNTSTPVPTLVGGIRKKVTVGSPGCVIRKRADRQVACPGDTITYTIDVQCQQRVATLLITDQVPANTTLIATSPGGVFNAITGEVSWVINGVSSATVTMTVRVAPTAPIPSVISDVAQLQIPITSSSNVVNVQVPPNCPPPRQICIDFDKFLTGAAIGGGTLITTQFQSLGVIFTSNDPNAPGLTTVSGPVAVSPPNVVMAGSHLGNTMTATFVDPATNGPGVTDFVSIITDNDAFGRTEMLIGLDLGGNVVATANVDFSLPGQVVSIATPSPMIHQVRLLTSDFFDDLCFAPVRRAANTSSEASGSAEKTPSPSVTGERALETLLTWALMFRSMF